VLIIAHRGASFDAPENTLAAVWLAWRQHADAVEVDVHLTRDDRLVVIHDPNTRRTAKVNRKVEAHTFQELHALDVGSWKDPAWHGEKIPTLDEVLATVPLGKRIFIEIKTRGDVAPALAKTLAASPCKPEQIVIIGFSLPAMQSLKRAFPEIEICWLSVLKRGPLTHRLPSFGRLVKKVKHAGLNGLDLAANRALTPGLIKKLRFAGLSLYVWTVDTPATARKLAEAGVDGLTTNRPGWLRQHLPDTNHNA